MNTGTPGQVLDTPNAESPPAAAAAAVDGGAGYIPKDPVTLSGASIVDRTAEPMDSSPATGVDDWISPENRQFTEHLQRYGSQIRNALQEGMDTSPVDRKTPMPGMAKVKQCIEKLVREKILADQRVSREDQKRYQQLIDDFDALEQENYPWNQTFPLTFKAAHFVSFYYHDKIDTSSHGSKYKAGATLEKLQALPWHDVLANPEGFVRALNPLWHSHHLRFDNGSTILEPLPELLSSGKFFFPCTDELDLLFFNRTTMLGLHPLGFITDACIRFDGADGLCADFFEHDILHGSYFVSEPELFMPARVLTDHGENGDYRLVCYVDHEIAGQPRGSC